MTCECDRHSTAFDRLVSHLHDRESFYLERHVRMSKFVNVDEQRKRVLFVANAYTEALNVAYQIREQLDPQPEPARGFLSKLKSIFS